MAINGETPELTYSWPLFESGARFDLGGLIDSIGLPSISSMPVWQSDALARQGIGLWECDLRDNSLAWSPVTYDIFGFARGSRLNREACAACYAEGSRAIMERLRGYAIRHRRGFTLDVELRSGGPLRHMRLIAAPVCNAGRVVRLQGVKRLLKD